MCRPRNHDQCVTEEFSLKLLGQFAVHRGEQSVELPPTCQRLIGLVALKRRPVHRLWVCAMLWPHAQTRRAIASLRSTMWRLRPMGADPLLEIDPSAAYGHYALGQALKQVGRRQEARTHLRLACALAPDSALYRAALARLG